MLPGQSHADPSSFYTSVYSQGQRPDSHTLYTLFSRFECLLFTALHPAARPKLASDSCSLQWKLHGLRVADLELCWSQWGSRMDGAEIKVEMESWKWEGAMGERKAGDYSQCLSQSERRLHWRKEREEGGEGDWFSVLVWVVSAREMMTAAPYKTWTSAGVWSRCVVTLHEDEI